jgi:MoaA/NifB/PqqE/SkfB family radical SAM enzyme
MKLESIGFYTLSDERAKTASSSSDLKRCELLVTDACNFRCPYCRGPKVYKGHTPFNEACRVIEYWAYQGLKNVRFSGGEPTVYPWIVELVAYAHHLGIERIAISTNGSASRKMYEDLVAVGANDFSVSFDACCASGAEAMAGVKNVFETICDNIKYLSSRTYVTLGVVVTPQNINELKEVVQHGHELGAQDIRIISSAQFNRLLDVASELGSELLSHPILKYRVDNIKKGRGVRGLQYNDSRKCGLMLDDMVVNHGKHYPCVIYMREHGDPVGDLNLNTRSDRQKWYDRTDTHQDPICKQNCLDVCIDYNNKFESYHLVKVSK